MNINRVPYKVRDIVRGFNDSGDNGVVAFGGSLDIRPPYQREFIYKSEDEQKVIDTVLRGYPLNVMYWGVSDIADNMYELIDGQQRTMSLCRFVKNMYSISYNNGEFTFSNLPRDIQEKILDYELDIYKCEGDESEKLAWFETINIAGEPLTKQELKNAVYTGPWLTSAKQYFSKNRCPASEIGEKYVKGVPNRQELLETALKWIAHKEGISVDKYMSQHRRDANASELWDYFSKVISWTKSIFNDTLPNISKVNWGILYNKYADKHFVDNDGNIVFYKKSEGEGKYTRAELIEQVEKLFEDDDITSSTGIYDYIFSGDERKLSIRAFPDKIKKIVYQEQGGRCKLCGKAFAYEDMAGDHIDPWSKGGKTIKGNCQMLCITCNSRKSAKLEKAVTEFYCKNCGKPVQQGMFCQYCGTKN